jgi:hypothetical protein
MEALMMLPREWSRWIAENRLLGVSEETLVDVLAAQGFRPEEARAEVRTLESHPAFEAGSWMVQRLRKLESVLDTQHSLRAGTRSTRTIDRRPNLSRAAFFNNYYAQSRPLLLPGFARAWTATREWTPLSLAARFGDEPIEVMVGREADPDYEKNAFSHRSTMTFREYASLVASGVHTNDVYLVANNHLLERPALRALFADFPIDERYLDPSQLDGFVFLWFGPAGTMTPLHHDPQNVLFVQVHGRKQFWMVSPLQTHRVYNDVGVYAEVDVRRPDYDQHPRFRQVQLYSFTVRAGDALFIPVGWWHQVESLDPSISLSFTNFRAPNSYEWADPAIVR